MSGLLGGADTPKPEPPAAMPDANDPIAQRKRRQAGGLVAQPTSSTTDRLAPVPGTLGREFTRSTLGAN
jgi:hypothetical protein